MLLWNNFFQYFVDSVDWPPGGKLRLKKKSVNIWQYIQYCQTRWYENLEFDVTKNYCDSVCINFLNVSSTFL